MLHERLLPFCCRTVRKVLQLEGVAVGRQHSLQPHNARPILPSWSSHTLRWVLLQPLPSLYQLAPASCMPRAYTLLALNAGDLHNYSPPRPPAFPIIGEGLFHHDAPHCAGLH